MTPSIRERIATRVPEILTEAAAGGQRRLAIYGAGAHTEQLLKVWRSHSGPEPECILTTRSVGSETSRFGLPLRCIGECDAASVDGIVLSSHNYEYDMMLEVMRRMPAAAIYSIHDQGRNISWMTQEIADRFLPGEKITIYDIGALGISDLIASRQFWPRLPRSHLRIVAFEPDTDECDRIRAGCEAEGIEVITVPLALGARPGKRKLYISDNRSGSSVFPPDLTTLRRYRYGSERFDLPMATAREAEIEVASLDGIRTALDLPEPDFIKINAEGSELDIVTGGTDSIRAACAMQVELSFIPKFVGGCLFSDVDPVLRRLNYEFCDIVTLNEIVHDTSSLNFYHFDANKLVSWNVLGSSMRFSRVKFEGHFLYLNRRIESEPHSPANLIKAFKAACLQETYGHPAAAMQTLERLAAGVPNADAVCDFLEDARNYFRLRGVPPHAAAGCT